MTFKIHARQARHTSRQPVARSLSSSFSKIRSMMSSGNLPQPFLLACQSCEKTTGNYVRLQQSKYFMLQSAVSVIELNTYQTVHSLPWHHVVLSITCSICTCIACMPTVVHSTRLSEAQCNSAESALDKVKFRFYSLSLHTWEYEGQETIAWICSRWILSGLMVTIEMLYTGHHKLLFAQCSRCKNILKVQNQSTYDMEKWKGQICKGQ